MSAAHVYAHGDVLGALCPILLIVWIVLLLLGVIGLVANRPFLLDPIGAVAAGLILLVVWAVIC